MFILTIIINKFDFRVCKRLSTTAKQPSLFTIACNACCNHR